MKRNVLRPLIAMFLTATVASACAGSPGAATIASETSSITAQLTTVPPSPKAVDLVSVPSVVGLAASEAEGTLAASGFTMSVTGDTSSPEYKIIAQLPASAAKSKKGSNIVVTFGESKEQKSVREKAAADAAAAAAASVAAEAAAAAAAAAAADADLGSYGSIDERTWALVTKDPDSHVGEKYVIFGVVTQFDAATGTSTFRANTGASQQEHSYQYDVNTLVDAVDAAQVADIVKDDILRMYVKVKVSYSYDTQIGGTTTVPRVLIHSSELIGHDD